MARGHRRTLLLAKPISITELPLLCSASPGRPSGHFAELEQNLSCADLGGEGGRRCPSWHFHRPGWVELARWPCSTRKAESGRLPQPDPGDGVRLSSAADPQPPTAASSPGQPGFIWRGTAPCSRRRRRRGCSRIGLGWRRKATVEGRDLPPRADGLNQAVRATLAGLAAS